MNQPLRIAMIGLDTSHVKAFTTLLHDTAQPHHVSGARVVTAFPGGSPDFDKSIDRVEGFTNALRDEFGVKIVGSIAELEGTADAIFLESVDGRVHLEQFRQVAGWGLPVFIDKPLAVSSQEAREIAQIAGEAKVRVMSASAIRYAQPFRQALDETVESGAVAGGDFFGPVALVEKAPGFFWYGIHSAEMLYATMGPGCRQVTARRSGAHDLVVAEWADGRIGTLRGNRTGNNQFGGVVHREKASHAFNVSSTAKPYYASLLDEVMRFLAGETPLAFDESVEVIRFLEAANESVETGKPVAL